MLPKFTSKSPNLVDVLTGLRPGLVRELAAVSGADRRALTVIFSGMPWADQATLAAYDALRLRRGPDGRVRVHSVAPWAVEMVKLAGDVTFGADTIEELRPLQDEVQAVARTSANDAVQAVALLEHVPEEVEVTSVAKVVSMHSLETVKQSDSVVRVLVQVLGAHGLGGLRDFELDVLSSTSELTAGGSLLLAYKHATMDLRRPDFVALYAAGFESTRHDSCRWSATSTLHDSREGSLEGANGSDSRETIHHRR